MRRAVVHSYERQLELLQQFKEGRSESPPRAGALTPFLKRAHFSEYEVTTSRCERPLLTLLGDISHGANRSTWLMG